VIIAPLSDRNASGQVTGTNTVDRSTTSNQVYDAQGRMLIAVGRAQAGDLPGRLPGSWYLDYYTYDANGRATVSTHLITGHVHTHPPGPDQNIPSPRHDLVFAGAPPPNATVGQESYPGVRKYILNKDNLVEYDKNGVKNINANNCP